MDWFNTGTGVGQGIYCPLYASLVAQPVKRLPAMWVTQVRSLGWEDPLEEEMAIHPVLLPGKFHGLRSLVGYSPGRRKESDTTERLHYMQYIFNLHAEYIMLKAKLDELQAGIKIAGRNINNLIYVDDAILIGAIKEELKNLLMRVKEGSEKAT